MVKADLALTDRVLQNLIGNALKYCSAGNTVTVSAEQRENKIWISITDNGPGISVDDLPYVFDRFKRGRTEKQGTGLGLAIVKSALELQKEKYTVHSEEGKGTTFQFSLSIA
jgi:signal transduction histidine kinase